MTFLKGRFRVGFQVNLSPEGLVLNIGPKKGSHKGLVKGQLEKQVEGF